MSKDLFNLVEEEIRIGSKISAIEKLKKCGLEHDRACAFAETVILMQKGYFSPIVRLKRKFLGSFGFWYDKRDSAELARRLSDYLISIGHYSSTEDVNTKVQECQETYTRLETDFDYFDELYHYSSVPTRVVIVLINLHFSDFNNSLQEAATVLIGKE